jgi:hypothetical protein
MRQDGTTARKATTRHVPEWRLNKRTFEVPYLMKLGNISRQEAQALIARCELSIGCPFGPNGGDWSYQASALTGGSE